VELLKRGKRTSWAGSMRLLLMLWIVLISGCVGTKLDQSGKLMKEYPKGFKDAVNASEESEKFVRECFKAIIDLEAKLESQ